MSKLKEKLIERLHLAMQYQLSGNEITHFVDIIEPIINKWALGLLPEEEELNPDNYSADYCRREGRNLTIAEICKKIDEEFRKAYNA